MISFFFASIWVFCASVALYLSAQIPNVSFWRLFLICAARFFSTSALSHERYSTWPSLYWIGYTTRTTFPIPDSSHSGGVISTPLCLGGIYLSPSLTFQYGNTLATLTPYLLTRASFPSPSIANSIFFSHWGFCPFAAMFTFLIWK